jgi:hypothetical protein
MGGTVWPLKMVSGTFSSQSSASALLTSRRAASSGAASVDANVASDRSEYKMERMAMAACCSAQRRWSATSGARGCDVGVSVSSYSIV